MELTTRRTRTWYSIFRWDATWNHALLISFGTYFHIPFLSESFIPKIYWSTNWKPFQEVWALNFDPGTISQSTFSVCAPCTSHRGKDSRRFLGIGKGKYGMGIPDMVRHFLLNLSLLYCPWNFTKIGLMCFIDLKNEQNHFSCFVMITDDHREGGDRRHPALHPREATRHRPRKWTVKYFRIHGILGKFLRQGCVISYLGYLWRKGDTGYFLA